MLHGSCAGGELLLLQNAGTNDRSKIFASVHSAKAGEMLPAMFVATIVDRDERAPAGAGSSLLAPSDAVALEPALSFSAAGGGGLARGAKELPARTALARQDSQVRRYVGGTSGQKWVGLWYAWTGSCFAMVREVWACVRTCTYSNPHACDLQGSVFSDSCSSLEALEAYEIGEETTQKENLSVIAEAHGDLPRDDCTEAVARSEEVELKVTEAEGAVQGDTGSTSHVEIADKAPPPANGSTSLSVQPLESQTKHEQVAELVTASLVNHAGQIIQDTQSWSEGAATPEASAPMPAAAIGASSGYPRAVPLAPFEPEAALAQSLAHPTSTAPAPATLPSAAENEKPLRGRTLDAQTIEPEPPGHTPAGAESKCPFAAVLKAAGHDIAAMPRPANLHRPSTGSPVAALSGAGGHCGREKTSWKGFGGLMSELPSVPETRPVVGDAQAAWELPPPSKNSSQDQDPGEGEIEPAGEE